MKALVLVLLFANVVLAGLIFAAGTQHPGTAASTDFNAEGMRLVPLPPPSPPSQAVSAIAPAPVACIEWSDIAGADLQRAKNLLAPLVAADRVVESRVEGPVRFSVYIPTAGNAHLLLSQLKEASVNGSLQPDNSISLGSFSTEESALRLLTEVKEKGFFQAKAERRNPQVKQASLTVRDPSGELVSRLNELQGQFIGSSVRPMPCPGEEKAG